jgi:hypothetical protein
MKSYIIHRKQKLCISVIRRYWHELLPTMLNKLQKKLYALRTGFLNTSHYVGRSIHLHIMSNKTLANILHLLNLLLQTLIMTNWSSGYWLKVCHLLYDGGLHFPVSPQYCGVCTPCKNCSATEASGHASNGRVADWVGALLGDSSVNAWIMQQ